MPSPFEMVAGIVAVLAAPEGTLAPELSRSPPPPWELLGYRGASNISEDGVTLEFTETIDVVRSLAVSAPERLFRTDEDLLLKLGILDIRAETFAEAMGQQVPLTVSAGSGTAGYIETNLVRAIDRAGGTTDNQVNYRAVLIRTPSPYGDGMFAQFWLPKAYISLSGALHYTKGEAWSWRSRFLLPEIRPWEPGDIRRKTNIRFRTQAYAGRSPRSCSGRCTRQ